MATGTTNYKLQTTNYNVCYVTVHSVVIYPYRDIEMASLEACDHSNIITNTNTVIL